MIVVDPSATAVTSPADETVAIVVSEDDHVTVASDITVPPASFTVEPSVTVSFTAAKVLVLGETSTVDAI